MCKSSSRCARSRFLVVAIQLGMTFRFLRACVIHSNLRQSGLAFQDPRSASHRMGIGGLAQRRRPSIIRALAHLSHFFPRHRLAQADGRAPLPAPCHPYLINPAQTADRQVSPGRFRAAQQAPPISGAPGARVGAALSRRAADWLAGWPAGRSTSPGWQRFAIRPAAAAAPGRAPA